MNSRLYHTITIFTIWCLIVLFILQPGIAHEGAEAGAKLFLHALLPYLLPYIILTQWLLKIPSHSKDISQWTRFIKAYILGSFGGFPVGAVTVTEMTKNGELTKAHSGLLLAVCHAPGPMFIIGFVGIELFGDLSAGWKLLAAIHIANVLFFLFGLLIFFRSSKLEISNSKTPTHKVGTPFLEALKESSTVIILVATTVIFFSALGTVLSTLITSTFTVEMGISKTIALAILEMTSGVQSATDHFAKLAIYPFLIALIISMNGLSIHMQVFVIAKAYSISLKPYVAARVWSMFLVPIIFYIIY